MRRDIDWSDSTFIKRKNYVKLWGTGTTRRVCQCFCGKTEPIIRAELAKRKRDRIKINNTAG